LIPEKISLMLVDTLRYDCVGYHPDKKHIKKYNVLQHLDTPTLDKLSKESMFFTRCYSTSSMTQPVMATIFTGTKEVNHGIRNNNYNPKLVLNENVQTIAEILKKLGYLTVYAGDHLKSIVLHKINRGFDFDFTMRDDQLFKFLLDNVKEKIFLFCEFYDVHGPYLYSDNPPSDGYNNDFFETMDPIMKKFNLELPKTPFDYWNKLVKIDRSTKFWFPFYVKGVTKFDKGRLRIFMDNLEKANFLDKEKSLLIITADHGEGKHTHEIPDVFEHGGDAYDETVRVPFIVRIPGVKHEIRDDLVSNIDAFKIILDFCTENKTNQFLNHKIYSINPFTEKREFAWYVYALELLGTKGKENCIHARTIITKNKKYTLRGKPETFFDKGIFDLNETDFVWKLYSDLLARRSSVEERKKSVEKLKTQSKIELYESFLRKWEYKRKKIFFMLDLNNDPFEENQINPFHEPNTTKEFLNYFKEMIELERPDVKNVISETKLTKEEEKMEEEVRKELEKLGYL